jgi:hypothetical protein
MHNIIDNCQHCVLLHVRIFFSWSHLGYWLIDVSQVDEIYIKLYLPTYARSQIPIYKLCLDLLVQEKRRVSFMYFCTHENINVFISTDRSSFPNNKISIFTGRPLISSIFWNTLDLNLRQLPTLPSFKSKLQQNYFQPKTVPSYFSFEDRYLSVLLHAYLTVNDFIK